MGRRKDGASASALATRVERAEAKMGLKREPAMAIWKTCSTFNSRMYTTVRKGKKGKKGKKRKGQTVKLVDQPSNIRQPTSSHSTRPTSLVQKLDERLLRPARLVRVRLEVDTLGETGGEVLDGRVRFDGVPVGDRFVDLVVGVHLGDDALYKTKEKS